MLIVVGLVAVALWTGIGVLRDRIGCEPPVIFSTLLAAMILCVAPFWSHLRFENLQAGQVALRWGVSDWTGVMLLTAIFWGLYERTDPIKIARAVIPKIENEVSRINAPSDWEFSGEEFEREEFDAE
jgi:hypothetical protein